MVRITKVYTKTGDKGMTTLAGGQQVSKTSRRIESYGEIDELNAALGLVAEAVREKQELSEMRKQVIRIQNELFDLGAQLAVLKENRRTDTPVISQSDIKRLENEIDVLNEELPILNSFILPGGGEISARMHMARTICRRAERNTIRLSEEESLDGTEIPYLNRLSDWLFVAGRYMSKKNGVEDTEWRPGYR